MNNQKPKKYIEELDFRELQLLVRLAVKRDQTRFLRDAIAMVMVLMSWQPQKTYSPHMGSSRFL